MPSDICWGCEAIQGTQQSSLPSVLCDMPRMGCWHHHARVGPLCFELQLSGAITDLPGLLAMQRQAERPTLEKPFIQGCNEEPPLPYSLLNF